MTIETQRFYKERKEDFSHYDAIVVSPGFDNAKHGTGLHWDTRLRLLAGSAYYTEGLTPVIVVGGARLGNMKDSFANLMERALIQKYKIPENDIIVEEDTFDTASQLKWITKERKKLGENVAIVADSQQKKHFLALLEGYDLKEIDILSSEDIVVELADKNDHIGRFVDKLHKSPYWMYWEIRERLLTFFTQKIDKKGEWLEKFTKRRLNS